MHLPEITGDKKILAVIVFLVILIIGFIVMKKIKSKKSGDNSKNSKKTTKSKKSKNSKKSKTAKKSTKSKKSDKTISEKKTFFGKPQNNDSSSESSSSSESEEENSELESEAQQLFNLIHKKMCDGMQEDEFTSLVGDSYDSMTFIELKQLYSDCKGNNINPLHEISAEDYMEIIDCN